MRNKQNAILILLVGGFLWSCDKNKTKTSSKPEPVTTEMRNGLPSDVKKIHGYFYVSNRSIYDQNGFVNYYSTRLAGFGDPSRNLLANYNHEMDQKQFLSSSQSNFENVKVGDVYFNGSMLSSNGGGSYQEVESFNNMTPGLTGNWVTTGNKSFIAINVNVSRGFPVVKNTYTNQAGTYTISLSKSFTYNIGDNVSNYDTLYVKMSPSGSSSSGVKKKINPGVSSVTFTKEELQSISGLYMRVLSVMAYNYSTKTVRDKIYVFELSSKVEQQFLIYN